MTAESVEHAPCQILRSLNAVSPIMPIALLPPIRPQTQSVAVQCVLLPTSALTASTSAAALDHRAAPPMKAVSTAPHSARETADRRWKRKVREELRVLRTSEVDDLSLVALQTYLRAMGVVVSREQNACPVVLKGMLHARLERMRCDVWTYDPDAEGRPKTPCRRCVVDRYMNM